MATKIGFMSFSAFELKKADEFDGIKTRLYDATKPARRYFDIHPFFPPWKTSDQTAAMERMVRKTPAELTPLMNEYYRYFAENAVRHEMYLRWLKRHAAWHWETEIYFRRFDDLRDYLNEKWNHNAYVRQGKMHVLFHRLKEKQWLEDDHKELRLERNFYGKRDADLQVKAQLMEHAAQLKYKNVTRLDDKKLQAKVMDQARHQHETHEQLVSPLQKLPRWAHLMAVAAYMDKAQGPMPMKAHEPVSPAPPTEEVKPPAYLKPGKVVA